MTPLPFSLRPLGTGVALLIVSKTPSRALFTEYLLVLGAFPLPSIVADGWDSGQRRVRSLMVAAQPHGLLLSSLLLDLVPAGADIDHSSFEHHLTCPQSWQLG